MPNFVTHLLAWTRRRPLVALLGSGLLGWLVYTHVASTPPVSRAAVVKAQTIPGLGVERATMEKTLLDVQKDNAVLQERLKEQGQTLHAMQQAQQGAERERQAAAHAQEQRLEDILKRAQQVPRPAPQPVRVVTKAPRVASVPTSTPLPEPSAVGEHGAKVRILRSDKAASFTGPPPAANRGDVAYLPAGSFANARVVTGAIATSRAGGALPVLFSVVGPFQPPWQLQGPGVTPVRTEVPAQGCFVFGKAQADLGASRVLVQIDLLSCVMPDAATMEVPIRGYVVDVDGSLGMVGRLETHDSAVLAKTFLTSLLAGAAESFRLAKQTSITTPLGGTISTQQGQYGETAGFAALANASAQLSQFYLSQASQLLPTLALDAGHAARLVLQEGLSLEGYPVTTLLVKGR